MRRRACYDRGMTPEHPIILFDGACGFCEGGIRLVVGNDPAGRFRFAPLQSDLGRSLLRRHGLPEGGVGSVVLIDRGRALVRSEATLRIASGMRTPWPRAAALGRIAPRAWRDAAYDLVARNRTRYGLARLLKTPRPAALVQRMLA